MKTLIGFALGAVLSLGTVGFAAPAATKIAPPAAGPDPDIEVIVVTGKHPAAQPIGELIGTVKHAVKTKAARTPPAMPIEVPKVEFAAAAPPPVRF